MRPSRRIPLSALAAALTLSGCGGEAERSAGDPAPARTVRAERGLTLELPPGWQVARTSLTPALGDPREVLTAATFALLPGKAEVCNHMPESALADIGARGALLTLQERGLEPGSQWLDFPARPANFGPELGGRSEASECVPGSDFRDHWFGFTDGGRHFHVLVAFGPDAPADVQAQAWTLLDSVEVDPDVRPDWRSAG